MQGSAKVRAARKTQQKARIAAKKKGKGNDYAEFFANQPQQKLKAEINDKVRTAREEFTNAMDDLSVAEITGEGLLAAQETAHVSGLFLNKLLDSKKPGGAMVLTAVGSAT